jgi:hypothetical protein
MSLLADAEAEFGMPIDESYEPTYDMEWQAVQWALHRVRSQIEGLEEVMSMIAYCDDPEHQYHEPHGLYRSHMIRMAKSALGDTPEPGVLYSRTSTAEGS